MIAYAVLSSEIIQIVVVENHGPRTTINRAEREMERLAKKHYEETKSKWLDYDEYRRKCPWRLQISRVL